MSNFDKLHFDVRICKAFYQCRALPESINPSRSWDGFIYYVKGGHRFIVDDQIIETSMGDFIYLPYKAKYKNQLLQSCTEYYEIDILIYDNGVPRSLSNAPKKITSPDSFPHLSLLRSITDKFSSTDNSTDFLMFSDICRMIELTKSEQNDKKKADGIDRIIKSVAYINERYYEDTSIEEIAAMSSTCISNFERIFKRCFSISPAAYRNNVRINRAQIALLSGYGIAETAAKVGFCDQFYFSKIFKQVTGITPGEYINNFTSTEI